MCYKASACEMWHACCDSAWMALCSTNEKGSSCTFLLVLGYRASLGACTCSVLAYTLSWDAGEALHQPAQLTDNGNLVVCTPLCQCICKAVRQVQHTYQVKVLKALFELPSTTVWHLDRLGLS